MSRTSTNPNERSIRAGESQRFATPALIALLIILTIVVYIPAMGAGFIWDDDDYLLRNDTLRSVEGLRRIWLEPGAVPQYYPLVHTMFWFEYRLWGLHPSGFHIVNIVLHAFGAVLLFIVLQKLKLPRGAAWVAAAVFALHPVHVESVAWVTERKNVLSIVLYFLALLAYLRFDPIEPNEADRPRHWGWYAISMLCFLGALFSKTVTCSLPAAILLLIWWKRGRISLRDVFPTLPMFLFGAMGGAMTGWMEKYHVGATGSEWHFSIVERCLIAGRNVWFYAQKLVLPIDLSFVYKRWEIDAGDWRQYLFPLGAVAVVIAFWLLRKRIGRGPLVGLLFFGGTLFPALGFFDVYPFRFSFVADHFQYLASVGLIVLIIVAAARTLEQLGSVANLVGLGVSAILLATLGWLSFQQAGIYRTIEGLWRDTLTKNPNSFMPVYNLAHELATQGRSHESIKLYGRALELKPGWVEALNNLGLELAKQGDEEAGIEQFKEALRIQPDFIDALNSLGAAYARQGKLDEAAAQFNKAIEIKPDFVDARINLGVAFMRLHQPDHAIAQFQEAVRINPRNPKARYNLGLTLMDANRMDEAIEQLLEAEKLAPKNVEIQFKLGRALAATGRFDEAVAHLLYAEKLAPELAAVHEFLAMLLIDNGRHDEAIRPMRLFVTLVPGDVHGCITLAELLLNAKDQKLRDPVQAIILAERACNKTRRSDPQLLDLLAKSHAAAGEWPQAAMVAREAIAQAGVKGNDALAQQLEDRVKDYESNIPQAVSTQPSSN